MELLNLKVKHKIFGEGVIIKSENKSITIRFQSKESKFIYPDCFENSYVIAVDESVQTAIMAEIEIAKQALQESRQTAVSERRAMVEKSVSAMQNFKNIEDGFGADYNVKHLARQPILTYQQVEEQFGIKIAGFGRGINNTPSTVVLISSVDKKKSGFVYHDRWTDDGDYIYSGEGKVGDQTMTFGNKAIVDAETDGKKIHLFVKFSPQEYYYQGVFILIDYTYEDDKDESGNMRKEYKFRLRKKSVEG